MDDFHHWQRDQLAQAEAAGGIVKITGDRSLTAPGQAPTAEPPATAAAVRPTSALADRVMLRNARHFAEVSPRADFAVLAAGLTKATALGLVEGMRFGTTPDASATAADLACALDGIDSLRRAREWEISDDLLNGSHWAGAACAGCAS